MLKKVIVISGIVVGFAAIFLFFFLEDMSGPMTFVNGNTPIFVGMAGLSGLALVLFLRKRNK